MAGDDHQRSHRAVPQQRPMAIVASPLLVVGCAAAALVLALSGNDQHSSDLVAHLVTAVFVTSGYHYIKQAYGVVRLGASFRGIRLHRIEATVLRYGIYPAWIFSVRRSPWLGSLPPTFVNTVITTAKIAVWVGVGCLGFVLIRIRTRTQLAIPSTMVAPYAAALVWLVFPINLLGAAMVTAMLHSLQYLACCHRAEVVRPECPVAVDGRRTPGWTDARHSAFVFATAAVVGVLLVNAVPNLLDRWFHNSVPLGMFGSLLFVTLNLTHYVIDGLIWRSDGPLVKSFATSPNRL